MLYLVRLAAEPVTVELLKSKCLSSLYYGLEACPLSSADFKSLEYVVVGAFMKILSKTRSKEVATSCMEMTAGAATWKLRRPSCVLVEGTSMSWRSAERKFARPEIHSS